MKVPVIPPVHSHLLWLVFSSLYSSLCGDSRLCLIPISLMTNNADSLFMGLMTIYIHYFMKPLFKSFAYFYRFYWFFLFLIKNIRLLYTFCVHVLYQIYCQYFLLVCDLLVHFLKDVIPVTQVFHYYKVQFPIVPFDSLFGLCPF